MGILTSIVEELPFLLLRLPIVLISLSFHEMFHALTADKLGDSTAKTFGRITMNPLKHIDPFGFICMLLFQIGWAKPVPVNTRNFKKPRRDMALTALAGPLSNLLLAIVFSIVLRIVMLLPAFANSDTYITIMLGQTLSGGMTAASIIVYMLYMGIILNISLAVFNMIPIPPLDGSRILNIFLPTKIYFGIMKYERIIYIVLLIVLFAGLLDTPITWLVGNAADGVFKITGMPIDRLYFILQYVQNGIGG